MEANDLLEPSKLYFSQVKPAHKQNCEEYFNQLVNKSKVDVEENRLTNKNIRLKEEKIRKSSASVKKKKTLKGFLIFFTILFFILVPIMIFILINGTLTELGFALCISIAALAAILGIVFIIIIVKKLNPAIKSLDGLISQLTLEKNKLIEIAIGQMAPLNCLFDYGISAALVTKTIPLIQMDPYFDESKFQMLQEKYDFKGNPEKNISTVFVQSGSILGNPFLLEKNYVQEIHDVKYTGSITIHWTTTHRDSKGNTYTEHHTQTLTASIYKPAPYYYYDTWLVYGNDAASRLSFTRNPSNANNMSEAQIQKYAVKFDKTLDKMTQDAIKNNKSFQRLGNNEFEALFNALDRDNNVEFRLLFTPLAQKNMVDLIKNKVPYGDDFCFVKRKCLNYIKSNHSQNMNYDSRPDIFAFYDIDKSREFFINYNDLYMQSIYYDLAPLMSIPLYQQHAAQEYIFKGVLTRNVTEMETEVMANEFKAKQFAHPNTKTNVIVKSEFVKKEGSADLNKVHAYSFDTIHHVEIVRKMGGDGRWHDIPIDWIEYIPLHNISEFVVQRCNTTKYNYDTIYKSGNLDNFLSKYTSNNAMIYKKGFISFLNSELGTTYNGDDLNNIFNKGDK